MTAKYATHWTNQAVAYFIRPELTDSGLHLKIRKSMMKLFAVTFDNATVTNTVSGTILTIDGTLTW